MAIAIVLLSIVSHLSPGHAQQSLTIDEQQQPAMQMLFNEFLGSVPADGKTNYYGQQLVSMLHMQKINTKCIYVQLQ